jgi:hypothetical protein
MRLVAGVNGILFIETLAAEGAIVFAKACELRPRGHWLKTKKPRFRQDVTHASRRPGDLSLIGR